MILSLHSFRESLGRYFSSVFPQRRHTRSFVPSGRNLCPRRVPLLQEGHRSKTFEIDIDPSFSTMPPLTFLDGFTASTRPVFPRSRPVITRTWSPLLIPAVAGACSTRFRNGITIPPARARQS